MRKSDLLPDHIKSATVFDSFLVLSYCSLVPHGLSSAVLYNINVQKHKLFLLQFGFFLSVIALSKITYTFLVESVLLYTFVCCPVLHARI